MNLEDSLEDISMKVRKEILRNEPELHSEFMGILRRFLEENEEFRGIEIREEEKIVQGRPDARIGALLLEFESPFDQKGQIREEVTNTKVWKVENTYIPEAQKKYRGLVRAIVTNGVEMVFIDESKEIVYRRDLSGSILKFKSWLTTLAPIPATPHDILDRLGPRSPVGINFIFWCYHLYDKIKDRTPIAGESFEVWSGLYKEATNLDNEARKAVLSFAKVIEIEKADIEKFLFAVETYLAVLMKLLVAEVSIQKYLARTIPYGTLRTLLGKNPVAGYKGLEQTFPFLRSVFEENVFDWFTEASKISKEYHEETKSNIEDMVDALDALDFEDLKKDLIRELYHGFFDKSTRRALGEFYTNEEIVDEILDFMGYDGNVIAAALKKGNEITLLDPACGSGTFLARAISRWEKEVKKVESPEEALKLFKIIAENVIGIDIHPLAVTMSRVNYLLALSDLLSRLKEEQFEEIAEIPVFWTDSLTTETNSQLSLRALPTLTVQLPYLGSFELPSPDRIKPSKLVLNVKRGIKNKWDEERFLQEFREQERQIYERVLRNIYTWFNDREKSGKNGRWLPVLKNALSIRKLQRRCTYVVGNPPWVRIHRIDKEIRNRLKRDFKFYKKGWKPNLRKTKTPFAEQYDYSLAFVESGLNYLKDGGKLGFVITSKVMEGMYAGELRGNLIKKHKILCLKDYSISGAELFKDATNYPLILVIEKSDGAESSNSIKLNIVVNGKTKSWDIQQSELPLFRNDRRSPWMIAPPEVISAFRKMHEKGQLLGNQYEVNRGVMTSLNEVFLVTKIEQSDTPSILVVTTAGREVVRIEKELIRPIVRGKNLSDWKFETREFIIWTHNDKGEVLSSLPQEAHNYFVTYKEKLEERDDYRPNQPHWTIFRVSARKLKPKVAWQELDEKMKATLLPESHEDPILGRRKLIPLQTVYFISPEDEKVGHSFAALFNSTQVRAYLMSFAERARGGYFRHFAWTVGLVPIPVGIETLAILSKQVHQLAAKGKKRELAVLQEKIDSRVSELYSIRPSEMDAVKSFYSFITRSDKGATT